MFFVLLLAIGARMLLGSMQTPAECVAIVLRVLRVCLAVEFVCLDDG